MLKKMPSTGKRTDLSLTERIRSDIESKILSGVWSPGHRIPNEHELTQQYSCSRMTVNKALSALAAARFIERRRRAGSFVAPSYVQAAVLEIRDVKSEITALGEEYRYEQIARRLRRATRADRAQLNIRSNCKVLALQGRHLASGRPFTLEDRILNLAEVPEAAAEDFSIKSPGTWLLEQIPWTEAEHRISAINADLRTAEFLDIPIGAACLVIERKTWRSEQSVTFVRLTFPGAAYRLFARFMPAQR